MRTNRIELLRCCLLKVIVLLAWCGVGSAQEVQEPKPTLKGRTFEEWSRLLPNDLDWETRADAYRAMKDFSKLDAYAQPAWDVVRAELPKEQNEGVLTAAYNSIQYQSLPVGEESARSKIVARALQDENKAIRTAHRNAFLHLFESTPDVIKVRVAKTEGLVDAALEALKEPDKKLRRSGLSALQWAVIASEYELDVSDPRHPVAKKIRPEGEYGSLVKEVTPIIGKQMHDEDRDVRTHAVWMLRRSYYPPEFAVEALTKHLKELMERPGKTPNLSDDEILMRNIVAFLKEYNSLGKPALPVLKKIQMGDNPRLNRVFSGSYGNSLRATIAAIEDSTE